MSKSYYCFSRVIFGVRGLHKCRRVGLCMLTVHQATMQKQQQQNSRFVRGGEKGYGGRQTSGGGRVSALANFLYKLVLVFDAFQVVNNY